MLCKRETSPEETHAHRASKSHHVGPHMGPNPIHTDPQHLKDVVVSRDCKTQTLFFPRRSVSSLHPQPSAPVGIQHQGDSPTRADCWLQPQLDCSSAEGWSLNTYRVHRLLCMPAIGEKKTVGVYQHLVFSELCLWLSDFCPQITKTI